MYGIDGRECLPEEELAHLEGYMGSAPVRIGNVAATQLQLDVYGELMDSVYLCNKLGLLISIHQSLGGVEQSGVSLADKLDGVGPAFGRRRALLPWRHPAKNGTGVARLVRGRMGTPCCKSLEAGEPPIDGQGESGRCGIELLAFESASRAATMYKRAGFS
jgi:hypothetical protein